MYLIHAAGLDGGARLAGSYWSGGGAVEKVI